MGVYIHLGIGKFLFFLFPYIRHPPAPVALWRDVIFT